jgi:hypothetical protein
MAKSKAIRGCQTKHVVETSSKAENSVRQANNMGTFSFVEDLICLLDDS